MSGKVLVSISFPAERKLTVVGRKFGTHHSKVYRKIVLNDDGSWPFPGPVEAQKESLD